MGTIVKYQLWERKGHTHTSACGRKWDKFKRRWDGRWAINYVDGNGQRHRQEPIGLDKKVAQQVLKAKEGAAALKVQIGVSEDSRISFADFADKWLERMAAGWKPETLRTRTYTTTRSLNRSFAARCARSHRRWSRTSGRSASRPGARRARLTATSWSSSAC